MNRIDAAFSKLREKHRKGLITYITAGDPDLAVTGMLVEEMSRRGADIIELGVPFSDPLADGPVIQAASQRALMKGVSLRDILCLAGELRERTDVPLALMTYYNPVYSYGIRDFACDTARMGVDGVIVPDLPLEESAELAGFLEDAGVHFIYFLAPTSTQERIMKVAERARGFIYCVSVTGVTGAREGIPTAGRELLERVRPYTDTPLALGFGISSPQQAALVPADAVIVGSAIVKLVEAAGSAEEIVRRVGDFVHEFASSMKI